MRKYEGHQGVLMFACLAGGIVGFLLFGAFPGVLHSLTGSLNGLHYALVAIAAIYMIATPLIHRAFVNKWFAVMTEGSAIIFTVVAAGFFAKQYVANPAGTFDYFHVVRMEPVGSELLVNCAIYIVAGQVIIYTICKQLAAYRAKNAPRMLNMTTVKRR